MSKKRKIRADFRKNREVRTREKGLTRRFAADASADEDDAQREQVRAKGSLSRRRTVAGAEVVEDDSGTLVLPEVDKEKCRLGRVLLVQGLVSIVEDADGRRYRCATRRLLKTLSTDQRHVVAVGDRVWIRVEETGGEEHAEGWIERVEPRRGVLSRASRGRQHVIVANVDQLVIVTSAAEPRIKPNLIDRYLVTAERARITPIICVNKFDLVDPADLMPLVGVYGQLGYEVLLTSAESGQGVDRLRARLLGKQSVLTGQSGVGKTSLLNAIEPGLARKVNTISEETQKGRHTTSSAELIRLETGDRDDASYVVDTPGIRQFQLWDVIPEEVAGYYRELRPYVAQCRFADCTHTHEEDCAVKDAVADGWIDSRRYESYLQVQSED